MKNKRCYKKIMVITILCAMFTVMFPITSYAESNAIRMPDEVLGVSEEQEYMLGTTQEGSFTEREDEMIYTFLLPSSGRVELDFKSNLCSFVLRIYDCNGKEVWTRYDDGRNDITGLNNMSETLDLTQGQYYFEVTHFDYPGDYNFIMNFTSANETFPETTGGIDNSFDEANSIRFGRKYNGQLAINDECDYFQFTVSSLKGIALCAEGNMKWISYEILDERGKIVWNSRDNMWNSETKKNILNDNINLADGTYYIKVQGSTMLFGEDTGSYSINIYDSMISELKDVGVEDWFFNSVAYVNSKGLMTGLNTETFGSNQSLARAQFAVILHRMNGVPEIEYAAKFPDVPDNIWFTDAVLWANEIGIVTGYSNTGLFGPADSINREQMAVMMYRYAQYMKYDTNEKADFGQFEDASKVSNFAKEAMQWAVGTGIITGKDSGTILDPKGNATRAECATIIMRFQEEYVK